MKPAVIIIVGLVCFYGCQPNNGEGSTTTVTETIIREPSYDSLAIAADTLLLNQMLAENIARYKSQEVLAGIIGSKIKDSFFIRVADSVLKTNYALFQAIGLYKNAGYIQNLETIKPVNNLQLQLIKNMENENLKQKFLRLSATHNYETMQSLEKLSHYPDKEIKRMAEYFLPVFTHLVTWQKNLLQEKNYTQ